MAEPKLLITTWFKKCELDTNDPKWSSYVLDRFLEEVTSAPGGSLRDVYQGLDIFLKTYTVELTPTVANFIKDVTVQGFAQYRSAYNSMGWRWANEQLAQGASAARCYLFLRTLPPEEATAQSLVAIYRGLQGTPYQEEAANTLSDDLEKPEIQQLLAAK